MVILSSGSATDTGITYQLPSNVFVSVFNDFFHPDLRTVKSVEALQLLSMTLVYSLGNQLYTNATNKENRRNFSRNQPGGSKKATFPSLEHGEEGRPGWGTCKRADTPDRQDKDIKSQSV